MKLKTLALAVAVATVACQEPSTVVQDNVMTQQNPTQTYLQRVSAALKPEHKGVLFGLKYVVKHDSKARYTVIYDQALEVRDSFGYVSDPTKARLIGSLRESSMSLKELNKRGYTSKFSFAFRIVDPSYPPRHWYVAEGEGKPKENKGRLVDLKIFERKLRRVIHGDTWSTDREEEIGLRPGVFVTGSSTQTITRIVVQAYVAGVDPSKLGEF